MAKGKPEINHVASGKTCRTDPFRALMKTGIQNQQYVMQVITATLLFVIHQGCFTFFYGNSSDSLVVHLNFTGRKIKDKNYC